MDLNADVPTAYGNVPFAQILHAYEKSKQWAEKKKAWMKTEEGKAYNRQKSKDYYERHKAQVLQKRAKRYETDKDTLLTRAKQYYALHSEELIQKYKERRENKKQTETEA